MHIIQRPSPNRYDDRRGWKVDMICNHVTEGYLSGALSWLRNPDSGVSANFVVARNGSVYELVPIDTAAWCNGTGTAAGSKYDYRRSTLPKVRDRRTNANYYTVSIEHEGFTRENGGALTEAQYKATLELHKHIITEVKRLYGVDIPIDRNHIVGHYQIAPKEKPTCPGPQFPWARLMADLARWKTVPKVKDQQILGQASVSQEAAAAWVRSVIKTPKINCTVEDLIRFYWEEGAAEGVRPELALCLSIKETGWWQYGNIVQPEQNNFGGLGAFNNNKPGQAASFPDCRTGVRAVVQHMRGYATKEPLRQPNVDPRYQALKDAGYLGASPTVHGLGGKWAVPGVGYGEDITARYEKLLAFAKTFVPTAKKEIGPKFIGVYARATADIGAALRIVHHVDNAVLVDGSRLNPGFYGEVVQVGGPKDEQATVHLAGQNRFETDRVVTEWMNERKNK